MTKNLTITITDGFTRFSDTELEENYYHIVSRIPEAGFIVCDFRWKEWFDLWALIQLLFILGSKDAKRVRRVIRLLSPEAIQVDGDEKERKQVLARLRFLSDMEFLDRAEDLGVELWLQYTHDRQKLRHVVSSDIRQLVAETIDQAVNADSSRPIIPITRFSDLDLKEKRDRLYQRTDEIFGEFFSESIVQQAGLGDCLLSELVMNVKHHGGGDGYIALRAGRGLRRVRRESLESYERSKYARLNHPLGDWRSYFQRYPDDAYFELVVADQGQGIAKSIMSDPRIPPTLKEGQESMEKTHTLLQHALRPDTSRLSPDERKRMDLTEFTGLAAVEFVLTAHEGSLLIREARSRHIFGAAAGGEGIAFEQLTPKRKEPKKLSTVRGVSLTAIIPMRGGHTELPGFAAPPETCVMDRADEISLQGAAIFRINPPAATYLDQRFGMSWNEVLKSVRKFGTSKNIVLVDVLASSVDKNELWSGLTKVRKACKERGLALVLCGVDQRLAHRLDEYAALDQKRIAGKRDWVLFGFGDDCRVYCFGEFAADDIQKHKQAQKLVESFLRGSVVAGTRESLLGEANYFTHVRGSSEVNKEEDEVDLLQLRASLSQLRSSLHTFYARSLEAEIKQSAAWLPDQTVLLTGGDKVADYLCIHSMTQMRDLYPDISRLSQSMVNTLDFDFVLSIGVASQTVAKDISYAHFQRKIHQGEREVQLRYYTYHDYFGFDHGETGKPVIDRGAKVLLLVDGVRKGDHCREAIEHVEHCEATVVAICSLFDLRQEETISKVHEIPLHCVLKMPVRLADASSDAAYIENPYTYSLSAVGVPENDEWSISLTKRQAYRYVEGYGLILRGHSTFFDQHFMRTVSLPYLLNSSSSLNAELIHNVIGLIRREEIDCIVYPEQSSISTLVSSILNVPGMAGQVKSIMCRHAVWPDRSSGYELDVVGKQTLSSSQHILILEDEVYTGRSIKNLAGLCFTHQGGGLRKLIVFTVIDSMMKAERAALTKLLKQNVVGASGMDAAPLIGRDIRFFAFMQFSLCAYWHESSCPLCERRQQFERLQPRLVGFVERGYAKDRIAELSQQPIDQNYRARNSLHLLDEGTEYQRTSQAEPAYITTIEGLEILCEEAYVEGDLAWLVARISPSHPQHFPPEVLLSAIELLSRDMALLLRVRLRQQMLDHVRYLLNGGHVRGTQLARMMEIFCAWPLHCLNQIWEDLWEAIFIKTDNVDAFMDSYPGSELLLSVVEGRPEHPLRSKLLISFDEIIKSLFEDIVPNDVPSRRRVQMAMCLRRSAYRDRRAYKSLGALIAEITFLLAYFELDDTSESHLILRRGLNELSKCEPSMDAKTHVYGVQMAGHLLRALEALPVYEPSALSEIHDREGYIDLKASIESLQKSYPHRGAICDAAEEVQTSASQIEAALYLDTRPDSLHLSLFEFLQTYRKSLAEALAPILSWSIEDGARLDRLSAEIELENLFVVMDDESVQLVFGELAENLKRAHERWRQRQEPVRSLVEERAPFTLKVEVAQNIDTLTVILTTPCTEHEHSEMKSGRGGRGKGMGQMKSALDRLGHSYESRFVPEREILVQEISMRRIHK